MGALSWRIEYGGRAWESPLPTHQVVRIMDFAKVDGWEVLDPLHSPKVLVGYLCVLVGEALDVTPEQVALDVLKQPLPALIECVKDYGGATGTE